MQKITPCLWFDHQAEEAVNFYTSTFKNSKLLQTARYGEAAGKASGRPQGSLMTATFELEGQRFMALNGGPIFSFTPAISLMVNCDTQEELDRLWDRLVSGGGEPSQCGWLKDKYGISWQIIPSILGDLMSGPDPKKSERVMNALVKMTKLDIKTLQQAAGQ